jgi:Trypsin
MYIFRNSSYAVRLGSPFRLQNDASRVVIAAHQKYIHPNYNENPLTNNIALLKLTTEPIELILGSKKIKF